MNRDQRIRDPIHNLISFSEKSGEDNLLWELLKTPAVQRLRRIKQLGFSDYVYPGATHSRLSHVLGAMQMARRMLSVFEKNQVFEGDAQYVKMRKATLSAALLHDVGHGPCSHVFEEISVEFGIKEDHEDITLKLIKETEIADILKKYGILSETSKFFEAEPGYDTYSAIVSGQMDCDRLDFLSRDRYYTGIKSTEIDLEWLFDSLRIEEVTIDPLKGVKEFMFVVLPKGISVAEEFVLSYMRMYQNVYFHKSTRAVQYMVRDLMKGAAKLAQDGDKNLLRHPIIRYFVSNDSRSIEDYLKLDDSGVVSIIRELSDEKYGVLSKLSDRYFNRDLYKCIELPTDSNGQLKAGLTGRFVNALKDDGVAYFNDVIPQKNVKQYDVMDPNYLKNILVKRNGEYPPLGQVSPTVKTLTPKRARLYFKTSKQKERAGEILKACLVENP